MCTITPSLQIDPFWLICLFLLPFTSNYIFLLLAASVYKLCTALQYSTATYKTGFPCFRQTVTLNTTISMQSALRLMSDIMVRFSYKFYIGIGSYESFFVNRIVFQLSFRVNNLYFYNVDCKYCGVLLLGCCNCNWHVLLNK